MVLAPAAGPPECICFGSLRLTLLAVALPLLGCRSVQRLQQLPGFHELHTEHDTHQADALAAAHWQFKPMGGHYTPYAQSMVGLGTRSACPLLVGTETPASSGSSTVKTQP